MRRLHTIALALPVLAAVGCSAPVDHSNPPPSAAPAAETATPASGAVTLRGRFESATGPFSQITFYDETHYILTKQPCQGTAASCTAQGTYTIDAQQHTLTIKDAATGEVTSGPFDISASDPLPPASVTTQSFQDFLGIGTLISDAANLVVRGFKWLGDFVGVTGFSSTSFACTATGMSNPDTGRWDDLSNLPDKATEVLTTSRGSDGSQQVHIDSLGTTNSGTTVNNKPPQPLLNGYAMLKDGAWLAMDDNMLAGRSGTTYTQIPGRGSMAFNCSPK